MSDRRPLFVVFALVAVLAVSAAPRPAVAGDGTAVVKLSDLTFDVDVEIDIGDARAIVVVKLEDDEPSGPGVWPCRVLPYEVDPTTGNRRTLRRVKPGAALALVNLSDEEANFKFYGKPIFVGDEQEFKLGPQEVKILKVKPGVTVTDSDVESSFDVSNPGCLSGYEGPRILIP